jgi:hypothetical protein
MISIKVGLVLTIFLGGLHVVFLEMIPYTAQMPITKELAAWQKDHVTISFTWFGLVGSVIVFLVGMLFSTPPEALARAERQAELADAGEDRPMYLRE